jgi:hypothetical protein
LKRIRYLKELIRKIEELKLKKKLQEKEQLKSKERPRFRHEDMKPYTDSKGINYVWNPEMMNYCPQVKVINLDMGKKLPAPM